MNKDVCISCFSLHSMFMNCIIRIFHLIIFFSLSVQQVHFKSSLVCISWFSFGSHSKTISTLSTHFILWGESILFEPTDLPLRYNRQEHCPTVIKAVFRAAVPFGKGFWDLYLPLKLQLPPPPSPSVRVVFYIREKQNKTMFSGRLITLISSSVFSWDVVSTGWEFCEAGEGLCHWDKTSTMGSTCLVSHQLIGIADGTLNLPIPFRCCYFSSWLWSVNCRVSVLCSFLQFGMGAPQASILLLETPGMPVQLCSWVSGRY